MAQRWSPRPTIARELVLDAVLMAVRRRRPRRTVIHSDQGSEYGSDDWRRLCKTKHLEPSMSQRGNCWDNAVAESFFSSLKKERIKKKIYRTRELAQAEISDYIDSFYNPTCRHSPLIPGKSSLWRHLTAGDPVRRACDTSRYGGESRAGTTIPIRVDFEGLSKRRLSVGTDISTRATDWPPR